jgi:hypothetical protein
VIERSSGGGALHIGNHQVQFTRPLIRLQRHSRSPIAPYRAIREFHDAGVHESAKYATGKNICATFDIRLIAALRSAIVGEPHD